MADETDNHRGEMLKQPFDLKVQLGDSELTIVDTRSADAYAAGHIPGAVRVDFAAWQTKSFAPGGMKDAKFWSEAIGALGISDSRQVIVYGDEMMEVTRVWWLLKYAGVTHASVLDGGWKAWTAEKYAVEATVPKIEPAKFTANLRTDRLADLEDIRSPGKRQILHSFSADDKIAPTPGTLHVDGQELLTAEGKFKSQAEIKKLLEARGLSADEVVTHCQGRSRAAIGVFALDLAGVSVKCFCGADATIEKE